MFRQVLEGIRDRVEGTIAVSLIGLDGIAIDSINREDVPLEILGAEFGGMIKQIRVANTELNTGDILQLSLVAEKYITFLSEITAEYFILLVLQPGGNQGRARFELAKAKHLLHDELI